MGHVRVVGCECKWSCFVKMVGLFKKEVFTVGFVLTNRTYYYFMYLICMPRDEDLWDIPVHVGAYGSASEKTVEVESVIIHPEYDDAYDYDVALLRLKTELEYNQEVAPVCLSHAPRSNSSLCFMTGYNDKGWYQTIVDIMNE